MYWHVESEDNLVRLAGDEIWAEIDLPDVGTLGRRDAAGAPATGPHTMMTRHPWLVRALAGHLMYGPGKARFDDCTLATYEQAGFGGAEADRAAAAVFTFVLGNTVGAAATVSLTRRLRRDGGDREEALRAAMTQAAAIAGGFRGSGPGWSSRRRASTRARRSEASRSARRPCRTGCRLGSRRCKGRKRFVAHSACGGRGITRRPPGHAVSPIGLLANAKPGTDIARITGEAVEIFPLYLA
ncbi:TetR/AcrR family transcriptional regulator C-terminal domain-containing protein [Amycolatopsis sp. NBC_00355]|uniref:TetR/AcrR family transcriptional regulator C-terminal domain-containing protein n=1 Tax=Amycolatopsis sp. NBC_00355 TaxID=2975957 RepID=UPI002E25F481